MAHSQRGNSTGRRVSPEWLVVLFGAAAGLLALGAGRLIEVRRFGPDLPSAIAQIERETKRDVEARIASLRELSAGLATRPDVARAFEDPDHAAGSLFDALEGSAGPSPPADLSLTAHAIGRGAIAWHGRASDLPSERLEGPGELFVMRGPLGLRLVAVEPVLAQDQSRRRLGAIAAEGIVSPSSLARDGLRGRATFAPPRGFVSLSPHATTPEPPAGPPAFVIDGPSGHPLLDGHADAGAIEAARAAVRGHASGLAGLFVALAVVVVVVRLRHRQWAAGHGWMVQLILVAATRAFLWFALPIQWRPHRPLPAPAMLEPVMALVLRSPLDVLLHALAALAMVLALLEALLRWRLESRRSSHGKPWDVGARVACGATQVFAGTVAALLVLAFHQVLQRAIFDGAFNAIHLALRPRDPSRLASFAGMFLGHAAVVAAAALVLAAAMTPWRSRLRGPASALLGLAWVGPSLVLAPVTDAGGREGGWSVVAALLFASVAAWLIRGGAGWFTRASQGRRVTALAAALVLPSLLLYPAMWASAERARERIVASRFATQAVTHPQELQDRLTEALAQIDGSPRLDALVDSGRVPPDDPRLDGAFSLWQATVLASARLTSAIEIYDARGGITSRFALNFPEYGAAEPRRAGVGCRWDVFGEASPFGAEERRMLRAERAICDAAGRPHGSLIVRVMLDYDALPFISSQGPYFDFFREGEADDAGDGLLGSDLTLVVYGWGRTPVYASSAGAWPLDEGLFARIYRSREPFWAEFRNRGSRDKVLLVNDRYGIYAVGYPRATWFDHFVHLAEIATLSLVVFLLLGAGASLVRRLARPSAPQAWLLARELRTSFSRKLFLAFVAASLIPVLVLAVAIRAYVASRLRADVEAEAGRTAAIAQRVAQEMLAVQRGGEASVSALTDDTMVWISRVIDQDVNIFVGTQLAATSERDLYASGLLPTRLPDRVYRAIVLHRQPAFVGEDRIAGLRYLMAAAPIRMREVDAVLTVPLTLQQREIEREVADLDRGVQLGAVVFILLGAAVGYWLAERISDPVERLTRASRRIAAGELNARVLVRTADELQRLVEAFNTMAVELERQRAQLEHTNRLEAWAEMARQVAHDIKNPLTPIQLSAEHLRRVHRDRGEPLSPVLDRCVDTILAQVRLLRRISAEFLSFATTPAPQPEPTDIGALLEEIGNTYRVGLDERFRLEVTAAPDLPRLSVDRLLVGRAVTNVIENALHALPGGGRIALDAARDGDSVAIRVSDTGEGMSEEERARVFEPYFSTKHSGTGLGLPIAKRNIELHGGSVAVDSAPGQGTVVTFRLPVGPPGEAVPTAGARP